MVGTASGNPPATACFGFCLQPDRCNQVVAPFAPNLFPLPAPYALYALQILSTYYGYVHY